MSSTRRNAIVIATSVIVLLAAAGATYYLLKSPDEISAANVPVSQPAQLRTAAKPAVPAVAAPDPSEPLLLQVVQGTVTVQWEHWPAATVTTPFAKLPAPSAVDAGTSAEFSVVDGTPAGRPVPLFCLNDGKMPLDADDPPNNFRFAIGTGEGRVKIDLHKPVSIARINSYSGHVNTRGPQVYTVYGSDGAVAGFNPGPKVGINPAGCGWKKIADVDTRPKDRPPGGRYAVSISDASGSLGTYRFLLFCMLPTESEDGFGHTFYSEIDIVE